MMVSDAGFPLIGTGRRFRLTPDSFGARRISLIRPFSNKRSLKAFGSLQIKKIRTESIKGDEHLDWFKSSAVQAVPGIDEISFSLTPARMVSRLAYGATEGSREAVGAISGQTGKATWN
jgi:hypothetical protein